MQLLQLKYRFGVSYCTFLYQNKTINNNATKGHIKDNLHPEHAVYECMFGISTLVYYVFFVNKYIAVY